MHIYETLLMGIDNFMFIVVEFVEQLPELEAEVNKANLLAREQHWLNWLFNLPSEYRYNFAPLAGSCAGVTRSAETRSLMSKGKKGANNPFFWQNRG